jgi:hypothetical protein
MFCEILRDHFADYLQHTVLLVKGQCTDHIIILLNSVLLVVQGSQILIMGMTLRENLMQL